MGMKHAASQRAGDITTGSENKMLLLCTVYLSLIQYTYTINYGTVFVSVSSWFSVQHHNNRKN